MIQYPHNLDFLAYVFLMDELRLISFYSHELSIGVFCQFYFCCESHTEGFEDGVFVAFGGGWGGCVGDIFHAWIINL